MAKIIKLMGLFIILISLYYFYLGIISAGIIGRTVSIFFGIYLFISAIGIYYKKNFARNMLIIISLFIISLDCFAVITFMPGRMKQIPSLVISSLLLFYFTRKAVKKSFKQENKDKVDKGDASIFTPHKSHPNP